MSATVPSVAAGMRFVDDTLARLAGQGTSEWHRLEATRDAAYRRLHAARDVSDLHEAFVFKAAIRECDARIFALWNDAS